MNRQTTPAEVLDELIRWMSQQLTQCESPTHDHGVSSGPRSVAQIDKRDNKQFGGALCLTRREIVRRELSLRDRSLTPLTGSTANANE